MKTKKTTTTATKTSSEIDLFEGVSLPRKAKVEVAEKVGDILLEAIESDMSKKKSSVSGQAFQKLSKNYKKLKQSMGKPGVPDLELFGDMKSELGSTVSKSGILEIGVFGSSAPKADGHNNLSGKSKLPLRQFLPKEGEDFRSGIKQQINEVVREAVAGSVRLPYSKLRNVTTKKDFYEIIRPSFGGASNAQIKRAILTNENLLEDLASRGLIGFL